MIKVLEPGVYNSVQDLGRIGFAKKGIPKGGAMDLVATKMANAILKNDVSNAVIEITYGLGEFKFTIDTYISLTGANYTPMLNGVTIKMNSIIAVKKEDVVSFGKRKYGARIYLAVKGGVQTEKIFNSRSFFQGITSKIRLGKGDSLQIKSPEKPIGKMHSKVKLSKASCDLQELECFKGPEFEKLNLAQKKSLLQLFTITTDNNRVGYRLKEIILNNLKPILTSAVLPGTVQLTPSGRLIVLMRDCQVTGGYPRVLQLTNESIDKLAQKMTNENLKFVIK
mgnify:CR=1 FL=1